MLADETAQRFTNVYGFQDWGRRRRSSAATGTTPSR